MKVTAENDAAALREAEGMLASDEDGEVWRQGYRVGKVCGERPPA
jgi:hypothetical protein